MPGPKGGGCAIGGKTGVRQGKRLFADDYHYDSLSGFRVGIKDSIWQQGSLRANQFADSGTYPLLGQRDAAIARKIQYATSDLQPDPKLTQDNYPSDDVFF
jgi:hypothetical protein